MRSVDSLFASLNPISSKEVDDWVQGERADVLIDAILHGEYEPRNREATGRRVLQRGASRTALKVGALVVGLMIVCVAAFATAAALRVRYFPGEGKPAPKSASRLLEESFRSAVGKIYPAGSTLGSIREVAEFATPDGHFRYYVAPVIAQGASAFCTLLTKNGELVDRSCGRQPDSTKLTVSVTRDPSSGAWIVDGALPRGATTARVRYPDGSSDPVMTGRGWFYFVAGLDPLGAAHTPVSIVTRGPQGVVGHKQISTCFVRSGTGVTQACES
jgi:hypothetical protein